jgi:hypothetical protein
MIITAVIFALVLGTLIFLVLPQASVAGRAVSVGIFLALLAMVYGGATELLGRPKPIVLEWQSISNSQILGAFPVENKAIYVWVMVPKSSEPRAYLLPWSQEVAQHLQNAMNEAETNGTAVEMTINGDTDNQGQPMFYAKPQPPLPAKDYGSSSQPIPYSQSGMDLAQSGRTR